MPPFIYGFINFNVVKLSIIMANATFYTRKDKADKDNMNPIWIQIAFNYQKFKKSTGIKIKEGHWNKISQRVRPNGKKEDYNNYAEYNDRLDELEKKAKDIIKNAFFNNIPLSKEYLESQWNIEAPIKPKGKGFFDLFEEFIEIQKADKASRTVSGHHTAKNFFREFKESTGYEIRFDNIDNSFFDSLKLYAFKTRTKEEKNDSGEKVVKSAVISDNYFSTLVARLKIFLNWATERGYNSNMIYLKFKAPEKEKDIICLSVGELDILLYYPFNSRKLAHVRDVYCFGCFTGLRWSDIKDLKPEHIVNDEIRKTIIKTKKYQKIPLIKPAIEILNRYKDYPGIGPLPVISSQKFNDYIKECCKEAQINEPITITKYSGGKPTAVTIPKYQLITSHTARKTFATLSLIHGMSERAVKEITGHKRDSSFNKYVKFADQVLKDSMDKAWGNFGKSDKPSKKGSRKPS